MWVSEYPFWFTPAMTMRCFEHVPNSPRHKIINYPNAYALKIHNFGPPKHGCSLWAWQHFEHYGLIDAEADSKNWWGNKSTSWVQDHMFKSFRKDPKFIQFTLFFKKVVFRHFAKNP